MDNDIFSIDEFNGIFFDLTKDMSWQIQGFVDTDNNVYPIDTDTKVLSTVFERLASPVIRSIANYKGYVVEVANQITYPDFTLTKYDRYNNVIHRIALDIKTTYAERSSFGFRKMSFTLGSYTSFLRDNTKCILFPFDTYHEHWVLGFIYRRGDSFEEYNMDNIPKVGDIKCPYEIEHIFLRDKVSITGVRAGSGNTANIGSVKLNNPRDFSTYNGPFCSFNDSKNAYCHYWYNYNHYKNIIMTEDDLINHPDFYKYI